MNPLENMRPDNPFKNWLWEKTADRCAKNLKNHGFSAHVVPDGATACQEILALADGCESFGFGGSATLREIGIIEKLAAQKKTIYDHWQPQSPEKNLETRLAQGRCDCFMTSANAVSVTGEIVNVDGVGNRTAAMQFGPKKVIIVAGMNKVAPDLPAALDRVKQVAGPMRAKSLNMDTPCAKTGVCSDCNAPQRICCITTILHRKPMKTDVSVILIRQEYGF